MLPYFQNLARFCATQDPLVINGTIYDERERLNLLTDEADVAAYLTLCLNTRHQILFNEDLVPVEIVKSHDGIITNLLSDSPIAASDIGPLAMDVWETDLIMNSQKLPNGHIDISEPINIFREFIEAMPTLVPNDALVAPFYSSEILQAAESIEKGKNSEEVPAMHNLGAAVIQILRQRMDQDEMLSNVRVNEVEHGRK